MSTEMKSNTRFFLTRFWGGKSRGKCLQIESPYGGYTDGPGYIQVTKDEAVLLQFANDSLEEKY